MANKKNKGFSLIEIIIAITILTLLLTPVIKQFSQTLNTNRKSKEQQYATEDAVYVFESFKKTDAKIGELEDVVDEANSNFLTEDAKLSADIECEVYSTTGTSLGTIKYNAYTYKLNDTEIGARNILYHRTVVLDDLANKLLSVGVEETQLDGSTKKIGYKVSYNNTSVPDSLKALGFVLTDEGSIVKYGIKDESTGVDYSNFVVAVVCNKADYVADPNEVNLGNIQDIDNTKMAIVNGDASSYDGQVESEFFAKAMENLRIDDYKSWEQAINHSSGESVLTQSSYADTIKKVTKIYIDANKNPLDETKIDSYVVKVDVIYSNSYTFVINDNGVSKSFDHADEVTHTVLNRTYYTDECPLVYIEYQPFANSTVKNAEGKITSVSYSANDYILVDSYVDDAKIYLYKPTKDELTAVTSKYGTYDAGTDTSETGYTYYTNKDKTKKVNIQVANINSKVKDTNTTIYTNLIGTGNKDNSNFTCSAYSLSSGIKTEKATETVNAVAFDETLIKSVFEDSRFDPRLFTVTVKLTPDDTEHNEIIFTGAKGDN